MKYLLFKANTGTVNNQTRTGTTGSAPKLIDRSFEYWVNTVYNCIHVCKLMYVNADTSLA